MNQGYLALIIVWFLILLSWIGVFDGFYQQNRISKKWAFGLMFISLVGNGFMFGLPHHGQISFVAYILPFLIAAFLWGRTEDSSRVHLLTASFLVGTSIFLLRLLLQIDPILMVMNERYMEVGLILFLVNVAARAPIQQFILLVFGLTFSEAGFQYYLWEKTSHYQLGSFSYSDLWWVTFICLGTFGWVIGKIKWLSFRRRKRAEIS